MYELKCDYVKLLHKVLILSVLTEGPTQKSPMNEVLMKQPLIKSHREKQKKKKKAAEK